MTLSIYAKKIKNNLKSLCFVCNYINSPNDIVKLSVSKYLKNSHFNRRVDLEYARIFKSKSSKLSRYKFYHNINSIGITSYKYCENNDSYINKKLDNDKPDIKHIVPKYYNLIKKGCNIWFLRNWQKEKNVE